jgi:hypothetical protein
VTAGRTIAAHAPARHRTAGRRTHREFAAGHRAAATTRTEFTTTATASTTPAPAPEVVRAGSPERSPSSREFASEFGG